MKILDLFSDKDYKIELDLANYKTRFYRFYPTLCINDMIYYQNDHIFNFDIVLNINNADLSQDNLVNISENTFNLDNIYIRN
jgi:hypothetical protein